MEDQLAETDPTLHAGGLQVSRVALPRGYSVSLDRQAGYLFFTGRREVQESKLIHAITFFAFGHVTFTHVYRPNPKGEKLR